MRVPCGDVDLVGDLLVPAGAAGIVLFAHGSGSSRRSPRNRSVAQQIQNKGLATLLFDLLTPEEARGEARSGELRFNIPLLTERLAAVTGWVRKEPDLGDLRVGYFGASTGAAAALAAATGDPEVKALVSRGGRTDLAGTAVENMKAATLLIAGGLDQPVMEWNHQTFERLRCVKQLSIISGATHLFEEEGTLEKVAELAASWFAIHLPQAQEPWT